MFTSLGQVDVMFSISWTSSHHWFGVEVLKDKGEVKKEKERLKGKGEVQMKEGEVQKEKLKVQGKSRYDITKIA